MESTGSRSILDQIQEQYFKFKQEGVFANNVMMHQRTFDSIAEQVGLAKVENHFGLTKVIGFIVIYDQYMPIGIVIFRNGTDILAIVGEEQTSHPSKSPDVPDPEHPE